MPYILPPRPESHSRIAITRRRFLWTAAGAGAVLTLGARTWRVEDPKSDARATEPLWALLSDSHIHASLSDQNQGMNMAANLLRVVSEVIASKARIAVIDGDLAKVDGQAADYRSFLKLVEPLRAAGLPVHLTLGNHDNRLNFLEVLGAKDSPEVSGKHCAGFDVDGVRWFLLDSLHEVNKVPGTLGAAQFEWLARELDAAPEKPALLFLHHNPERKGEGKVEGLIEADPFLEAIRPRRQVKAVFFGHTHAWRRWVDDGIHMVNLPAIAYAFNKAEPLGWVRATPHPEGLTLELRSLDGAHPEHGKKIDLAWRATRVA